MKTCPYCAEPIQPAAILCKHCHSDVTRRPSGRAGSLLLAAALGAGVALLLLLAGPPSAWALARARPLPAAAARCPYGGVPGVHPWGRLPAPGMPGRLPAWHPPIGPDDGEDDDGPALPAFALEGARTL